MKRSKRIYVLLGVLAAVSIATFAVSRFTEHKEQIKNSDEIILELPGDSVQSLSWEYESETLAFHKDEKWLYDDDEAFPVNEKKINKLLKPFEEFGVPFVIEKVKDFAQYGLDNPTCTINLKTKDKSYEILLGNYSNMDSERYVSIGDGNVYLVKEDPLDKFNISLSDMIEHDNTPSIDKADEIKFSGAETYNIVYEEDSASTYCNEDVYFTQQDNSKLPLDTSRVDSYLSNISDLKLKDYMTYNVSEKELQKYGLDKPELTITVGYTTEDKDGKETSDTFILNVSRDPEEKKAAEKLDKKEEDNSEEEEITAYARVVDSKIVYQISSDSYENLMDASYDSLRHLEVLSADFADIHQIDISLEGETYTITSKEKKGERIYIYQNEELEMEDFKYAVESLEANSFTDKQPQKKGEISLTVYLDNENYPKVQIELYRYNGKECLAVVDGKPVSLVRRLAVVDLIESVHAIVLD